MIRGYRTRILNKKEKKNEQERHSNESNLWFK